MSHPLFRPPAEAYSLILRIADGCPWNKCAFCGMYKEVSYGLHTEAQIEPSIAEAARTHPRAKRIFLADGDVMALSFERLRDILEALNLRFPRLARVNLYANGHSILRKSPEQLEALRALKLNTLYMGLESGSEAVLRQAKKRETAEEMIAAGNLAQTAGLKMSVMVLTGLGGTSASTEHAVATAEALNRMQPKLLSALRVVPIPGTALFQAEQDGAFHQLTEVQAVEELKALIEKLELEATVFRANHSSNILPLEGRFPNDKNNLLATLDALLASGCLDASSPGPPPLSL
ncbi:MAG: radical SAM protein [Pontiellaceae bacterium]|nr:radical SAM protein [Pontiellaceae bacterium]